MSLTHTTQPSPFRSGWRLPEQPESPGDRMSCRDLVEHIQSLPDEDLEALLAQGRLEQFP